MRNPLKNAVHALLHNPRHLVFAIFRRMPWLIPSDELYLKIYCRLSMGQWLNFEHPQTFNEKLQWLKLHNRKEEYVTMVDKYAVKDYVAKQIGEEYVIPTIARWDKPSDIEWDKLPNQFVLKTNHDGGGNGIVVCKDKSKFNKRKALRELRHSYYRNTYLIGREWPYKNVKKCVFAEQYLEGLDGDLFDYKFFCFAGKVNCYKIDFNRHIDHHANYYDRQGNLLEYGESSFLPQFEKKLIIPSNIEQMIHLAEQLAKDMPFVRVDMYNVKGKIYFGEITFFPSGGTCTWVGDVDVDLLWGQWLTLPIEKK